MIKENLKHLIIGFAMLFWFKGMYRILDKYIKDSIENNIIIVIISLAVFYYIDGSFIKIGSNTSVPYDKQNEKK